MLPNAFPAQLFVTNLCTMDKIGHLFYNSSWFWSCVLFPNPPPPKAKYQERNTQLTSKMLKKVNKLSTSFFNISYLLVHP